MTPRGKSALASLVCLILATSAALLAQETPPAGDGGQQPPTEPAAKEPAGNTAGVAAMEAMSQPGPFHRNLEPLVGEFSGESRFWAAPETEPIVSAAAFSRRWILGGRFVMEDYEGSIMNRPFSSMGIIGYDNIKRRFVATWCDTMGTGIEFLEGGGDPAGKSVAFQHVFEDARTGTKQSYRYLFKIENANRHTIEMWSVGPDGKEFRTLEIVCTRK